MATTRLLAGNSGYSWHVHPIASEVDGNLYFGGINNSGEVRTYIDGPNHFKQLVKYPEGDDDHNAPSLLVKSSKEHLVFYAQHHQNNYMRYRKSSDGGLNFGCEQVLYFPNPVTYAQAINYGNTVLVFTRSDTDEWHYKISDDWGATWSEAIKFFDYGGNQAYMNIQESETTAGLFHVSAFPHPSASASKDIYYCTIDLTTGDVAISSSTVGNVLTGNSLPLTTGDFDALGVVQNSTQRFRVLDVGDKYGTPVIYYARWENATATPYYFYAKLSSGTWSRFNTGIEAPIFGYSGDANYLGGISIDKNGDNHIYVSQKGSGGTWSINKYPLNSDLSWGTREILVTHATLPLVRPYAVYGSTKCLYQEIQSYPSYVNYSIAVYELTP